MGFLDLVSGGKKVSPLSKTKKEEPTGLGQVFAPLFKERESIFQRGTEQWSDINKLFREQLERHPAEAKIAKSVLFPYWEGWKTFKSSIVARATGRDPSEVWKDRSFLEIPRVKEYVTSSEYTETFKNVSKSLVSKAPVPSFTKQTLISKIDKLSPNQIAHLTESTADLTTYFGLVIGTQLIAGLGQVAPAPRTIEERITSLITERGELERARGVEAAKTFFQKHTRETVTKQIRSLYAQGRLRLIEYPDVESATRGLTRRVFAHWSRSLAKARVAGVAPRLEPPEKIFFGAGLPSARKKILGALSEAEKSLIREGAALATPTMRMLKGIIGRAVTDKDITTIRGWVEEAPPKVKALAEIEITDITPTFISKTIDKIKPVGFEKILRKQMGMAEWDKMSDKEKLAEVKEYARKDLEKSKEEAKAHPMGPVDYIVDRTLDPLDPMNEIYGEFLRRQGAIVVAGKSVKLPKEEVIEPKKPLPVKITEKGFKVLKKKAKLPPLEEYQIPANSEQAIMLGQQIQGNEKAIALYQAQRDKLLKETAKLKKIKGREQEGLNLSKKAQLMREVIEEARKPTKIPAKALRPITGKVTDLLRRYATKEQIKQIQKGVIPEDVRIKLEVAAGEKVTDKQIMSLAGVTPIEPIKVPVAKPPTVTDQQIINTVSLGIDKKAALPILQNIIIDGKKLIATDLNMTITYTGDKDLGQATVPADALKGASLDEIKVKNKKGLVQVGATEIQGTSITEAPEIPKVKADKVITIPAGNFLQELQKALPYAATDETRYILNGIRMEVTPNNIRFVTTDGRRLNVRNIPVKTGKTFNTLIHIDQIKKLNRILKSAAPSEITLSINKKNDMYEMKIGDFTIVGRQIEGEFPDYSKIIPKKVKSHYLIPREEFENVLKKIPKNLITRDSIAVDLKFSKGKLVLNKEIPGVGKWSEAINAKPVKPEGVITHVLLPMTTEKKGFDIAFNVNYLKDVLKTQDGDILMGIEAKEKPVVFYEPKIEKVEPIAIAKVSPIMRARLAGTTGGIREVRREMKGVAEERLQALRDEIKASIDITKERLKGKITKLEEEAKLKIEAKKAATKEALAVEKVKKTEKLKLAKEKGKKWTAVERAKAKVKLAVIQERLKEKKLVARKTAQERAKLSRILREKERGELLNEIGRRLGDKALHPLQFKNLMLKEFQVLSPMGLSNKELRRLIKLMEARKEELSIPIYPSEKELIERAIKETGKYPIPGFKAMNNLRRYGPSGKVIADKIELYEKDRLQYAGYGINHIHRISRLVGGPSKWPRFVSIIEGEIEPATDKEREALRLYNEIAGFYADKAEKLELDTMDKAGFLRKFHPRQNWWPRKYDRTDLEKEEFKKKAIEHISSQRNISEARAIEMYEVFRSDLKSAQFGHLERSRELDFPGYRRDMGVIIEYVTSAANRLSWVEQFGKDIFIGVGKGFEPETLVELIGRLPDRLTFPGFPSVYPRQEVRKLVTRMNPRSPTSTLATWAHRARTIQVLKLAFASIPNAFQWFTNTWPKIGTKNMIIGLWDRILSKKATDFAEISGATGSHRAMEMAEIQRIGTLGKVAEVFLKVCGFAGTEINNRILSALPGAKYAQDIAKKLLIAEGKGLRAAWYKWRTPYLKAELKKLYIDPEEVLKHGLSEQNLRDAGYTISLITQFSTRPGYIPSTWSSETGRLLTQFKNFAYEQSALLWNEALKPFVDFINSGGRRGNLNLFMYLIAIPIAGAVVVKIKEKIYRKKILDADRPLYLKMLVWAMQIGGFGIAADALFAMEYGEKGVYSFLGGPTLSDIVYTMANLYRTGEHVYDDEMQKAILSLSRMAGSYSPLFRVVMERSSKLVGDTAEMARLSHLIKDTRKQYIKLMSQGKEERAYKLWESLEEKFGEKYFEKYGKMLIPPSLKDISRREMEKEIPFLERRRKMLPGKGVKGFEYLQKEAPEKTGFKVLMK